MLIASATVSLLLTFAACEKGTPTNPAASEAPTCVAVGSERATLHLAVPRGFIQDEDAATVDVLIKGESPSGDLLPPQVALHQFGGPDVRDSDQELLDRALTFAIPFAGRTPERIRASRRIIADRLAEITFKTPALPDDRLYTVHAQLENYGGQRFAVVLIAPDQTSYSELASEVLPSIEPGPC